LFAHFNIYFEIPDEAETESRCKTMSEYFHYVNHNKQMRFSIGVFGSNQKFGGLGCGLEAKAFCLLLTKSYKTKSLTFAGSWAGDSVACVGDEHKLWQQCRQYKNVTANIIVMLYGIDDIADQLIQIASFNDYIFVQIAHLILSQRLPKMADKFAATFGEAWVQYYEEIYRKNPSFEIDGIADL
jgi:hypothetical protein